MPMPISSVHIFIKTGTGNWEQDQSRDNNTDFWKWPWLSGVSTGANKHTGNFLTGDNEGPKFFQGPFRWAEIQMLPVKKMESADPAWSTLKFFGYENLIDQTIAKSARHHKGKILNGELCQIFQQRLIIWKNWLKPENAWMTTNLVHIHNCSNVEMPPLVITKIMYNPNTNNRFSKQQRPGIHWNNKHRK